MRHRARGSAVVAAVVLVATAGLLAPAASAAGTPSATAAAPVAAPKFGFQQLTPARLVDTRSTTVAVGPGGTLTVQVLGRGGVPTSGVGSVALNITAVAPTSSGHLIARPTGTPRPGTSTVNFGAGQTVPNNAVLGVGSGGTISVYNPRGSTHVIVDVSGWFPVGSGVTAVPPTRVLDTRSGAALGPKGVRALKVAGTTTPSVPAAAVAVTINVTVTQATAASHLVVYPAGATRPSTSTLNMVKGSTVANATVATVGSGGQVNLYNNAGSVHVIVDVTGYLLPGMGYIPLTPVRVADTRSGDYYQGFSATTRPMPWGPSTPRACSTSTCPGGGAPRRSRSAPARPSST